MKKSFLIILGILIVAGVGSAIATQNLKKGAYTCPYYQSGKKVNCMIYVDKFGIKIHLIHREQNIEQIFDAKL